MQKDQRGREREAAREERRAAKAEQEERRRLEKELEVGLYSC